MKKNNKWHPQTNAIRLRAAQTVQHEHSSPLYLTSSFTFDDADTMRDAFRGENDSNIYSRYSNPTVDEFKDKMVALEGAEAGFATASGMAAVFASIFPLVEARRSFVVLQFGVWQHHYHCYQIFA